MHTFPAKKCGTPTNVIFKNESPKSLRTQNKDVSNILFVNNMYVKIFSQKEMDFAFPATSMSK